MRSLLLGLMCCLSCAPKTPVKSALSSAVASEPSDAIYFVLIDRFANGDVSNDASVDLSDPQAFHGGDLQGVIDHLDDLKSLGIRTVWLSPLFEMRTETFGGHGAFHGYWVRDLTRVEPRFGSMQTLKELSAGLHQRGMRLYLDMVYNHVGFDSPLLDERPDWFHPYGTITHWDDRFECENHQVHGLPDLAQEKQEVYDYLLKTSIMWIDEVQPDGFRIDAVRHMPLDFQRRIGDALREHKPGFTLLGEVFEGDPLSLSHTLSEAGFDAVFDFPLRYAMIDTFCHQQSVGRLGAVLSADRFYADPNKLVTFLDNHDVSRVRSECQDEASVVSAIRFLTAVRGVPSLYYGTEVGLKGLKEPDNRSDMRFVSHPLGEEIKRGLAQRSAHPELSRGRSQILALEPSLLVIGRSLGTERSLIAVNQSKQVIEWGSHRFVPGVSVSFEAPEEWPDVRSRLVQLSVAVAPLGPHEEVRLVGTGAELGNWDPEKALVLQGGQTAIRLPVGSVIEAKVVYVNGDEVRWADGANLYGFVDDLDHTVRLR